MTERIIDGPKRRASHTLILAHGAGAAMDTPFMNTFATIAGENGIHVVRFEFDYMAKHRTDGRRRPPDREPSLRQQWIDVIESVKAQRLIIGGKSMGGRIASLIADELGVAGLVCLGYPFHPTGKPEKLRTAHLRAIKTKTLIVQGERDPMGKREEVNGYKLSRRIRVHWLADGDHSFKPRKASGRTEQENWQEGAEVMSKFITKL